MRVQIEIDETLLGELRALAPADTDDASVLKALSDWVRIKRQWEALENLRGIGWEGDLEEMRNNWSSSAAE